MYYNERKPVWYALLKSLNIFHTKGFFKWSQALENDDKRVQKMPLLRFEKKEGPSQWSSKNAESVCVCVSVCASVEYVERGIYNVTSLADFWFVFARYMWPYNLRIFKPYIILLLYLYASLPPTPFFKDDCLHVNNTVSN